MATAATSRGADAPLASARGVLQGALNAGRSPAEAAGSVRSLFAAIPKEQIPWLDADSLPDRSLVRFRGFVQDNGLAFEAFPVVATIVNPVSGERRQIPLAFIDTPEHPWEIDATDIAHTGFSEKQPHFCTAVPAESAWATRAATPASERPPLSDSQRLDALSLDSLTISPAPTTAPVTTPGADQTTDASRKHAHAALAAKVGNFDSLAAASPVILKTYFDDHQLELNQIVEVVGILEKAREPTHDATDRAQNDGLIEGVRHHDDLFGEGPSPFDVLPCVHVILAETLRGRNANPLARNPELSLTLVADRALALRNAAIDHIQARLLGDRLAAEYLFLHLFSRVISHQNGCPVGSFPINLCRVPSPTAVPGFVSGLFDGLQDLVPRAKLVTLTIDALNQRMWMWPDMMRPVRLDASASNQQQSGNTTDQHRDLGLQAGVLQLVDGTLVMIDETRLSTGVLVERGLRNIEHLRTAIEDAQLVYGVNLGATIQKPIDMRFLILSEGRSMLPSTCLLPLEVSSGVETDASSHPMVHAPEFPDTDLLDGLRGFIDIAKEGNPEVSNDMLDRITRDFSQSQAASRAASERPDDGTLLKCRLDVAQMLRRSLGRPMLDDECWERAGEMEFERLARVARLPRPSTVSPTTSGSASNAATAATGASQLQSQLASSAHVSGASTPSGDMDVEIPEAPSR